MGELCRFERRQQNNDEQCSPWALSRTIGPVIYALRLTNIVKRPQNALIITHAHQGENTTSRAKAHAATMQVKSMLIQCMRSAWLTARNVHRRICTVSAATWLKSMNTPPPSWGYILNMNEERAILQNWITFMPKFVTGRLFRLVHDSTHNSMRKFTRLHR